MQVPMCTQKEARQGRYNNAPNRETHLLSEFYHHADEGSGDSKRSQTGTAEALMDAPGGFTKCRTESLAYGHATRHADAHLADLACAVLRTNRSSQYPEGRPGRPFQRAGLACSGLRPGSVRLRRGLHRTAAPHGLRRAVTKHNSRHQTALANKLRSARCFICEHHQSNNTHPPRQLGAETLPSLRSAAPKTLVVTATAWTSSMPRQQRPSSR